MTIMKGSRIRRIMGCLLLALAARGAAGDFNAQDQLSEAQVLEAIKQQAIARSQAQGYPMSEERIARMQQMFKSGILDPYYTQRPDGMSRGDFQNLMEAQQAYMAWKRGERQGLPPDQVSALKEKWDKEKGDLVSTNPVLADVFSKAIDRFGQPAQNQDQGQSGGGQDCSGRNRWRCALQQGDKKDAMESLNEVLKEEPGNVEALNARSTLFFQEGNMRAANADAARALKADPSNQAALAMFKLTEGRADSQGGNLEGQVAQADIGRPGGQFAGGDPGLGSGPRAPIMMTKRNPGAEAAVRSAQDAMRLGDMPAAVSYLDRALAADPQNLEALRLRAVAYSRLGRHDLSLRDAEAGLRFSPRDTSLLVIKAFNKNRQKDYKSALEAAALARQADPNNTDALANYAHALGGLGQREEMLSLLAQAAARDPKYQRSLEDARSRPVGGDILFLFPGEEGGASAQAAPQVQGRPARTRRYGILAGAAVLGGLLMALGLLRSVSGPLTRRVKTIFTPVPGGAEPSAVPDGPSTLVPRPLTGPDGGLLRGQFKILRQIGAGGMGLVFEGSDVTLNRPVAVKKMREELRLDRRERLRFVNEAKTVAALHHPNIVDIYAIIEEGDELYLVFEFVNGRTVHELLSGRGGLGFSQVLGVARGMAAALDYAHGRGIIHRDLKPSNVMVSKEGFVKVMDFGIARVAKDAATRVSMTNTVVGTPPYMAPEQEQGVVRKEADVYSLAICLYEMLSGRAAFTGTGAGMLMNKMNMSFSPITKEVPGLPQGIDLVFARAFQADPDKRFHTAGELVAALEALPAPARP